MGWFSSLFRSKSKSQDTAPSTFVLREGKSVPVDEAFRAWTSSDLTLMLKAVATKTNPIDRHFLLQSIVTETYKKRKEERYRQLCIEYSEKHIQEFPFLAPALKDDMGGTLPRVPTFQHYATVLTEIGEYEKAISICELAMKYDLHDNTNSGFEGRIERIRKKAEKNA